MLIVGIILFIFILLILVGLCMVQFVTHPNRPSFEETKAQEQKNNYWGNYDQYPKEEWNIISFDGSLIHGTYLPNHSEKYVIITHGYSYNHHGGVKYANLFYHLGYNVYLYDLRYHGANEHKKNYCTMGDAESRDLNAIIQAMYSRFGKDIYLGIHGESLGAASSLCALSQNQTLRFCIADCPFSNLKELLYYQAKQMFHLPKFMVHIANTCYRLLKHRDFFSVSPLYAVKNNQVPLLLIHGADDDFIPPKHSQDLYAGCPDTCKKEIQLMHGAKHAGSYGVNPTLYQQWVQNFLHSLSE